MFLFKSHRLPSLFAPKLTNTLQKKIDDLQAKLGNLRDKHLTVAEALEDEEEMEEE